MKKLFVLASVFISLGVILGACALLGEPATAPPATESSTVPIDVPLIPETGASPAPELIEHQTIPGDLPTERSNHAGDQDSSTTADQKRATDGDRFTFGRFERPFNSQTMDIYFPNMDIVDVSIFTDAIWVYSAISVKSLDSSNSTPAKYAMEIDLNLDGHGDLLVIASQPLSSDWKTDGVQVWSDTNGDVGGNKVLRADASQHGDGYETMLFDNGNGSDPDAAWVRISPDDPNTIQIAAKLSVLNGDTTYMVGVWAGANLSPDQFDINDRFTHEQAGAAMVEFDIFYPIKDLAELDNTCRLNIGFQAAGTEPGLCKLPVKIRESESPSIEPPPDEPPPPPN
jgi:hypothetical protein